jgi:hypothetical protein
MYSHERFIEEAIGSVLEQDSPSSEIELPMALIAFGDGVFPPYPFPDGFLGGRDGPGDFGTCYSVDIASHRQSPTERSLLLCTRSTRSSLFFRFVFPNSFHFNRSRSRGFFLPAIVAVIAEKHFVTQSRTALPFLQTHRRKCGFTSQIQLGDAVHRSSLAPRSNQEGPGWFLRSVRRTSVRLAG